MIWGSGGSKSRLAKAAGAELAGQMRWKIARRCGAKHISKSKCTKHFWKLRCRKSARRCDAKHISKSKCTKHTRVGPLLEVEMSKKCTPLWREAHFQVKMYKAHHVRTTFGKIEMSKKCTPLWREAHFEVKIYKTHHVRTTFGSWDVEKVHAVVARSTFPSQNVKNTRGSDHFWRFRCRFASLRYTTLHSTTLLHSTTPHYITQHYHYNYTTTLHYTPLHSTTLIYIHYTTKENGKIHRYIDG